MSNIDNLSENIKKLIVGYLTKSISFEDAIILKAWIEKNESNKQIFDDIRTGWLLSAKSVSPDGLRLEMIWNKLESVIRNNERKEKRIAIHHLQYSRIIRIAASWILIFSLGAVTSWWLNGKNIQQITLSPTEISAPLAAKSKVIMPDGSTVWLNAGSTITYDQDFGINDRKVKLVGEAFFSVTTNKEKPFTVSTPEIIVKAYGTKFNVKAYPEEKTITTTLEEGHIDIQYTGSLKHKEILVLKPNEKFVFTKPEDVHSDKRLKVQQKTSAEIPHSDIIVEDNVNVNLYSSWKDERWIIESLPLGTLAPILERRLNLKIFFTNEILKTFKFTGTIVNETAEQILEAMKLTAPLNYEISKDTITLSVNDKLEDKYLRITSPK